MQPALPRTAADVMDGLEPIVLLKTTGHRLIVGEGIYFRTHFGKERPDHYVHAGYFEWCLN